MEDLNILVLGEDDSVRQLSLGNSEIGQSIVRSYREIGGEHCQFPRLRFFHGRTYPKGQIALARRICRNSVIGTDRMLKAVETAGYESSDPDVCTAQQLTSKTHEYE